MKLQKKRFDYSWIMVAISFMMVFVCLGFCSSNKSLYLGAITEALGIKRSLFSLNDTCRFVVCAIVNLYFGTLVNRFGIRKMVAVGFAALIAAVLIYANATNIFVFYIGGCLLGVGLAFTTTTMVSVMVKRWVKTNTGTILGIVMAANGFGGAFAAQIVTPIIYQEGNPFGYRNAYTLVAVIVAVVGILAVLLIREKPEGAEVAPVGGKKKPRGGGWVGMEFKEALRQPFFIPAAVSLFFTGFLLSGVEAIGGTHLKDVGLDSGYVATVLSAHALVLTASKFLAGVCFDRKGLRTMLNVCNVTGIVSMAMLALTTVSDAGMVMAMLWGILSSLALPMETVGVSLVTSDLYGNKCFDQMMGVMAALNYMGYAVGIPVMNFFYDMNGSYKPIILIFTGIFVAVTVLYQFVISAAHKKRQEIEAAQVQ